MGKMLDQALKRPFGRIIRDCPRCGEGDERHMGTNKCGLCECEFVVTKYGTKVAGRSAHSSTNRETPDA